MTALKRNAIWLFIILKVKDRSIPFDLSLTNLQKKLFLCRFGFLVKTYLADVDVEDEGLVGADALRAALAVCEFGGDEEFDLTAFTNIFETFSPAFDYAVEGETHRVGFGLHLVKHGTVEKGALVAYPNGILV